MFVRILSAFQRAAAPELLENGDGPPFDRARE
jgi:hypothetical protein